MPLSSSTAPSLRFELEDGMSIAADAYGDPSAQPILFLHGGGQTRHAWGGSAEELARCGCYAITMDHRGHGDSSWAREGEYSLDRFAQDLIGVAAQLQEKPVVVGASLGGLAALLAEEADKEQVAKALVLVDITPRMQAEGVLRIVDFMRTGTEGFGSLDEAANAIAAYQPHRKRDRNLTGLAKNLRLDAQGKYRWHWDPRMLEFWDPAKHGAEDHREEIVLARLQAASRLTVPMLLIRGRMSDVLSEEAAAEFLRFVPHAEYVDLRDAAHMVAGDQNDTFTETVAEFILRHILPEVSA